MKIAIASGKGGTGKTTVSTNLAAFLSEKTDTVLIDLDVEEPNSGLFLKSKLISEQEMTTDIPVWESENCSHCGQCQKVCNFNSILHIVNEVVVFENLCHGCYACSELCPTGSLPMKPRKMGVVNQYKFKSLNFIEGKLDIGQEQAVPLISQTKTYATENLKMGEDSIFIYDCPPGTACPVIEAVKDADTVILVTEPTPFGLHDLKLSVEVMRKLSLDFSIVINRDGIGNDDVREYCEKEGIKISGIVPNMREISELYSKGELLFDKIPEVKSALENIARNAGVKL